MTRWLRRRGTPYTVRRHGLAEVVALDLVATMEPQQVYLGAGLNPFGDHGEVQALPHVNDSGSNCRVIRVVGEIADERAIDLQLADRELTQVAETGITRSEVVDRKLHAHGSQLFEHVKHD